MGSGKFEDEIICGFKVTSKRKEIWAIELELLKKIIEVCEKYDLTYFAIGGTLLGAVRHKGFIPWDDDIDIGMPRKDYEKLLQIVDKEFDEDIFFQTPYNDNLFRGHAQLRASKTTAVLPYEINGRFNQGIFIDIFPYDEYPVNKLSKLAQGFELKFIENILRGYYGISCGVKAKIIQYTLSKPLGKLFGTSRLYRRYEEICSKYDGKGSGLVRNFCLAYNNKLNLMRRNDMYNLMKMKFEDIYINVPKNYDKILKKSYGSYMEYQIVSSTHGGVIFDTERSYKEFIKDYKENKLNLEDYYI